MSLVVYDSMRQQKVPFEPVEPGKVRMYVCGLTVYDDVHIGHARTYVSFDVIRRYLEWSGYDVNYVQNITDVEDKIIKRAAESGIDFLEHAQKYTDRALEDLGKIGVRTADDYPKVSDYMPQIIDIIERIIANGLAYVTDSGSVYFDVLKKEGYGKLSNRNVEEMKAGARVEVNSEKNHPADFALWKAAPADEPHFDSPWGIGRPGWHIECSAMAEQTLGQPFDIHGGGRDLIFPHHENEVAQSEAAYNKEFARYWLHSGFLQVEGVKMSKSLGNFIKVRDLLEQEDPDAVRYYYALTHYRSPIDFGQKGVTDATAALDRLKRTEESLLKRLAGRAYRADETAAEAGATSSAEQALFQSAKTFDADFRRAMDDDFNTPEAIAALHNFASDIRKALDGTHMSRSLLAYVHDLFVSTGHVLAVFPSQAGAAGATSGDEQTVDALMGAVLQIRATARANKDWGTADAIRDALAKAGIEVQDGKDGAEWRKVA